jgi:hypothetical protein
VRGLFDGITGTWLRQMSYSMCRFWAYDQSKKMLGAGKDAPAWKLALAGSMGASSFSFIHSFLYRQVITNLLLDLFHVLRSWWDCGIRGQSGR